jgi:hypothetical protein
MKIKIPSNLKSRKYSKKNHNKIRPSLNKNRISN